MSIVSRWYQNHWTTYLLRPLGWLYQLIITARRHLYRLGLFKQKTFPVPIIVVGNITVGGTGKTPLVIWLAQFLRERGWRPGIVSRGYGGRSPSWPQRVDGKSDPTRVGDEAVLLARRAGVPVVVAPDRVAAVSDLLAHTDCNIVISDDGLQHYALGRDCEIAVLDGERRLGNACCLPAGPLRESKKRLNEVDFVVVNGAPAPDEMGMRLSPTRFYSLNSEKSVDTLPNSRVNAVAGIGNPQRFFNTLREMGLQVVPHAFGDHHRFSREDIDFKDEDLVVMTAKDAVKCEKFADDRHWYLAVDADVDPRLGDGLEKELVKWSTHGLRCS